MRDEHLDLTAENIDITTPTLIPVVDLLRQNSDGCDCLR